MRGQSTVCVVVFCLGRSTLGHCSRFKLCSETCRGAQCAQVRELYIERAKDVRRDLPLLAACAKDIATGCNSTGSSQVCI